MGATLHRGAWASHYCGLSCCGAQAYLLSLLRRLSNCGSRAELLRGMWDLPRPGLEPVSPALAGRISTTAPPGKPPKFLPALAISWVTFLFFFFWPRRVARGILVPRPGIKHAPPAVEAWSLNLWSAREVPWVPFLRSTCTQIKFCFFFSY